MCTCREIEKLLDAYTDGELAGPRRLVVEAHLQGCALCSRLERGKEEEARLVRSADPVPALSAGFTAQVMSNLNYDNSRVTGAGFFSLKALFARSWLAPALASLLLLATVSWLAARRLPPASPRQVAFQNSIVAGQTTPPPKTLVLFGGASLEHQKALAPSLPKEPEPEGTRESAIAPSPQDNQGAAAGNSSSGSTASQAMTPLTTSPASPPESYGEQEQQGYPVFEPGYLPPDYSLESCSPQPADSVGGSAGSTPAAAVPGQNGLLLTYRNAQTSGWITLEIQPLNSPAPQPVVTSASVPVPANVLGNQTAGTIASTKVASGSPGAGRITWQAQKNGASFLLTVTSSLPDEELQRVAASVH
jgi:anti-sigma factor RsiW